MIPDSFDFNSDIFGQTKLLFLDISNCNGFAITEI